MLGVLNKCQVLIQHGNKNKIMKICVPCYSGGLDDFICEHFGRALAFTIYDTDTGEITVVKNTSEHFGGVGKPPELLKKLRS